MFFNNLRYLFHSSIKLKIFFSMAGFFLFAIAIISALYLNLFQDYLIEDLKRHSKMSNTSIITAAEKAITNNNFASLQDLVNRIAVKYENVKLLAIFDFNWTIIASTDPERFIPFTFLNDEKEAAVFDLSTSTREEAYELDEKAGLLKSIKYIYLDPAYLQGKTRSDFDDKPTSDLLGYIYLELSTANIQKTFQRILLLLGIIIFFLLIVGFLGAYILSLYITKRIDTLAQKVRQISQGNLDVSIQPLSNDEISGLVKDVENMRLSIKDLRENLEEKVKSRTTQLEETNKELEAFAYSVSHDIREPLRSIRGFSQALLEDYASSLDAGGVDYVKRIVLASQRSSDLINDILRLSRISRGDMYIDNVNLSEMSIPICEELRKKHPGKNINFSIAEGMIAKGDPRFLKLALENLFSNACKYSSQRKNPQIDFGAIMDDKKTTFFIRDNGSGFDMAQAYKLFMPFQRLHADDQFDGSGIGLATVQRIIHRHGGSIWAKSEPGTGSVFYFTLQ